MNWERIYRIIETEGMIKSERKVRAVIYNAQCFLEVREESGTFSDYLWGFTNGKIILYMGHQKGGRPYKEKCARAQRNKRLYISKSILEKCQKSYENIPSEKGILYQMNRSTQNLLEYTKNPERISNLITISVGFV